MNLDASLLPRRNRNLWPNVLQLCLTKWKAGNRGHTRPTAWDNIPNLIQIHNTFSSPKRILYQRPSPCIQRNTTWIRVRSSCRDGRVMERRTALPPADDWQFIVIIFDQGVGEEWKLVPVPRTDLTSGSHGSKLNNTCELVKTKLKLSNFAPFILSHIHHLPHVQAHFLSFHTNSSAWFASAAKHFPVPNHS